MNTPPGTPPAPGIPPVDPETATGRAAELLAEAHALLGSTPNLTRVMAHSPSVLDGFLGFTRALCGGTLACPVAESVALLVAQEHACDYTLSAHTFVATKLAGMSPDDAFRARHGKADDETTAAALAFAAELLRGHGRVDDEGLAAARAAGLSDGQLTEVIAHVALNIFVNHLATTARVVVDWPIVRHTD
ncbi:carboxymuconolactone decarboxylase family protein [Yinghuangia seranimata]|uniref:carboxymuconolactone decarboxylase family protein n=1 Tax=Yinghuangia seranimata TaxID=408067 RepID=UPI00248C4085|nr:hypothetical protein [Yinghuangia seranimata]MDI2130924.1 hypothetical protein [Yinghuangia seranimata]